MSDGNATSGEAVKAAMTLQGKVEVSTVPLPARTEPEVQLSAVNAPTQVQQGEAFNVEVAGLRAKTEVWCHICWGNPFGPGRTRISRRA